jgi:hypothetical protein
VVFAEVDAAIAGDDSGEMEDVPLEGDGGVLGSAGDGVGIGGVADDPKINDFERQSDKQRKPQLGMNGSHTKTDGKSGVEVGWKSRGRWNKRTRIENVRVV